MMIHGAPPGDPNGAPMLQAPTTSVFCGSASGVEGWVGPGCWGSGCWGSGCCDDVPTCTVTKVEARCPALSSASARMLCDPAVRLVTLKV